ncbi:MAG TPA: hypothetical protein VKA15_19300, partial [Isosphaeraceae bacterium]|nr:hypothetical protein [Isosphaeraceae bacterium]
MGLLRDRLVVEEGRASLRSIGTTVSEIAGHLEAGATPRKLIGQGAVEPVDLIAALGQSALGDEDSLGPGLVQGKPPRP